MKSEFEQRDPSQPIAYDADGRPLYATPPQVGATERHSVSSSISSHVTAAPAIQDGQSYDPQARVQYSNEPGVRHAVRDIEPERRSISSELQKRHQESKRQYPFLNLSEGEVVILNLRRHPIGLMLPILAGGIAFSVLMAALVLYPVGASEYGLPEFGLAALILGLLMGFVGIVTYIAVWVYLQNQFFMTNESVIQEIQHSLFSRHEQTVSLGSIEDASFKKSGILQTLLDYGTIRLSTEGEETTYRFHFVANPRKQVAILNNGIEAFKNGRPVELADPITGN
jgi:hypothetical protein